MEIDSVFLEIGESGRQQFKYGLVLCLLKVYAPFHVLQYTFIGRSSTFYCSKEGETLTNSCFENKVTSCTNLTFTENTMVAEWGLVCDRNWLSKATMSALMMGFLMGALVLGNLADRIGRKSNLMLTLMGMLFFNLISSAANNYSIYLLSRFCVGFFVSGNILSVVVLISEIVGPSYRGIYGLAVMGAFPIGILTLSYIASHLQSWRILTMFVTLLGIPFVLCHWYLVESPRWFLSKNRQNEAEGVLKRIAKGNGVNSKLNISLKSSSVKDNSRVIGDSALKLFSKKRLLAVTLILCYNWFVNGASYYGMTLAAGDIGTDIYTGTALSGIVEVPAVFLCYYMIESYGRRFSLAGFMTVSGLSCLAIQVFTGSSLSSMATSLALFGKMCIAASFKVAYILSGEVFATSIRNSAMGLVSGFARVGSILSPFIVMAGESMPGIQFTAFGILGLTGGILSLWLPETKGKPLPETMSEMLTKKRPSTQHI